MLCILFRAILFSEKQKKGSELQAVIFGGFQPTLLTVTLTLGAAFQTCDDGLMHHYTKFGCKRFNSSGDMEESYFMTDLSSHCDLYLKDRNPNFLHNTPGHDDAVQ